MEFYYDQLRSVYSKILQSFVENLSNIRDKKKFYETKKYEKTREMDINNTFGAVKFQAEINNKLNLLNEEDIDDREMLHLEMTGLLAIANPQNDATVEHLIKCYEKLCNIYKIYLRHFGVEIDNDMVGIVPTNNDRVDQITISNIKADSLRINFFIDHKNIEIKSENNFIDSTMNVWMNILVCDRQPTPNEYLAVHFAYYLLKKSSGTNSSLNNYFHGQGIAGFRPHCQTYMALTDPGPGHVNGTVSKLKWMNKGVTMHLEHLERPANQTRLEIESYRMPSIKFFYMTRLHVGYLAPTTLYVGRNLKDSGDFEKDRLRVCRLFASGLNNMFNVGAAECKLSMDYLSTYQTIKHMRTIQIEIIKNPYQILSAAWNLNNILRDDMGNFDLLRRILDNIENINFEALANAVEISDRFEIGKRAVLYTKLGGFDKVTWDGASDTYPSKCIVPLQLSLAQGLELVHMAHSIGLITYFSAGFKFDEIKIAVFTGVDGVGIGGAQVLRLMDHKTGYHGPYQQENIDSILQKRDDASVCLYGKAVNLLSRLDTMYYEGSLTENENQLRIELFNKLKSRYLKLSDKIEEYGNLLTENSDEISSLIQKLDSVEKLPNDSNTVVSRNVYLNKLARVNRDFDNCLLKEHYSLISSEKMTKIRSNIKEILEEKSEKRAQNFYNSYPWLSIIKARQKKLLRDLINEFKK